MTNHILRLSTEEECHRFRRRYACIDTSPNARRNLFGMLVFEDEKSVLPIICGCGGSMHLCEKHAREIRGCTPSMIIQALAKVDFYIFGYGINLDYRNHPEWPNGGGMNRVHRWWRNVRRFFRSLPRP